MNEIYIKSAQAMHKLCMAKLTGNLREIEKWQNHVDSWAEIIHDYELRQKHKQERRNHELSKQGF